MYNVTLHGKLGKRFGRYFSTNVGNFDSIIGIIDNMNRNRFCAYMDGARNRKGIKYDILVGVEEVDFFPRIGND